MAVLSNKPTTAIGGLAGVPTSTTAAVAANNPAAQVASPVNVSPNSAYGIQARQALNNMGVDNQRIGYNNGYVTVDGQNIFRPQVNAGGVTYTDQATINSNAGTVRQLNNSNAIQQRITTPATNPMDATVQSTLQTIVDMIRNPVAYDPYSSPEYAAQQAAAQRGALQSTRAAQESMGASGFGRSTNLADRAQGIQNQANEYLQLQVIPQLIAANEAKQQQVLDNLYNIANAYTTQQGVYDTRNQNEFNNTLSGAKYLSDLVQMNSDNRRADAVLTGTYLTEEQERNLNALFNLKSQAEAKGVTKEQRTSLSSDADALRNLLQASGLDISSLGANSNLSTARNSGVGRTLAGQQQDFNQATETRQLDTADKQYAEQFAYQKARDAITDQRWQTEFDEDYRRYGLDYALKELQRTDDNTYRNANLSISQDDNARAWLDYENSLNAPAEAAKYSGISAAQAYDAVKNMFMQPVLDKFGTPTGETTLATDAASKDKMYQQVVGLNLPEGQDTQVMSLLGLTPSEIAAFDKQYLGE